MNLKSSQTSLYKQLNKINMEAEAMLRQNPQVCMQNSTINNTAYMLKQSKLVDKSSLFEQCQVILHKPYEARTPSQNNSLLKLLEKNSFLKELSDNISLDFLKGILRNAKIQLINEKQLITYEDQPLNYIVVVLEGKLGVQKSDCLFSNEKSQRQKGQQTIDFQALKNDQIFQKLTICAKEERQIHKQKSKLQRKSSFPVSTYDFWLPLLSNEEYEVFCQNIDKYIMPNQQYGAKERLRSTISKNRVAAMENTYLLVIQISFLFYWLEVSFKNKLANNIEIIKKIPCFSSIEEQKLAQVILSMKTCKKKKGDHIYYQDDEADNIYILLEGQVKLIKNSQLFQQNPNDLYVDRRKLVQQIHQGDKKYKSRYRKNNDDVLPFANFTTLYNYRPIKKKIEIGVISSFGLFGEEQVVFKKYRQTSAVVQSLEVTYYQIQFKKIIEILTFKHAQKFRKALQVSISKKILYRQHQYAEHIDLQNKTHMDYFYLEDGKQKQSPRKFKLAKINSRMSPKKANEDQSHAPAFYTTFNFNKMLTSKRYSSNITQKRQIKKTNQSSSESLLSIVLNNNEQRLVGISHSWNPIERKVKQQNILSHKLSPRKQKIDIQAPLIDQQYFRDTAKQKQRINKQYRTFRLSLGKKTK